MNIQAAIGYIHGHQVHAGFHTSLLHALLTDVQTLRIFGGRVAPQPCPHYFNTGRNDVTRKILATWPEVDVVVSLDTDQVFTLQQLYTLVHLVSPQRPVVSGLYHACDSLGDQVRPVALRRTPAGLVPIWDLPVNSWVECDVVGAGFLAIHRPLLERMRDLLLGGPWWWNFTNAGATFRPEDDAFCARVQALGGSVWVHTGLDIGHDKLVRLTAKDRRQRPKED